MGLVLKPRVGLLPRWNNNPVGLPPPVGCWMFNEGSGTYICDSSGNGLHSDKWAGSTPPFWTSAKRGIGIDFPDSADQEIRCGTCPAHTTNTIWLRGRWDGATDDIIASDWENDANRVVFCSASNARFRVMGTIGGYTSLYSPNNTLVSGGEFDIVAVIGATHALYSNGIQLTPSSDNLANDFTDLDGKWLFGGGYYGNDTYHFDGVLYSAGIWDHALTPAQVAYLYQYPYYAWEYPELWELYAAAAAPPAAEDYYAPWGHIDAGHINGGHIG